MSPLTAETEAAFAKLKTDLGAEGQQALRDFGTRQKRALRDALDTLILEHGLDQVREAVLELHQRYSEPEDEMSAAEYAELRAVTAWGSEP